MSPKEKTAEFADDALVVARQPFAWAHGVVQQGVTYRGSDPVVRMFPGNFVSTDTPTSELPSIWADVPEPNNDVIGGWLTIKDPPSPETHVWCTADFRASGIRFEAGQMYRKDHPLVLKHAANFEIRTNYAEALREGGE